MSNSFIHALSFMLFNRAFQSCFSIMHKAGHDNSGPCDKAKTTAAMLA
jgi:hypothetical protein